MLFATLNSELSKISKWFFANSSLLMSQKQNTSEKNDIPLKLSRLQINNYNIERILSIKFLGVLLDENLSWKDHIKYAENKIYKNTGILHKARDYLSKESLLSLYNAYIDTYKNFANLAWASTITHLTHLKPAFLA